ncbi:MAG: M23 family peptidase, partial [Oscillospiraceae bacterium]|nr:M23 family peptidase [Oscillospiraceae bacterium]
MKRNWIDQAADFMAGKGFYIVLLLCVAALGVSGYYLFDGISQKNQVVSGPAQITVTPTPAPVPSAEATLGAMPS